jgi:2-oxoisovalerate dehydrogenase E2 component (dihydrolipoyl transacylase)
MVTTMTQSLTIPHLGLSDEIDMTRLVVARESLKPLANIRGVRLTYMPFIIKAASLAMKSYPLINSKLNPNGSEVTLLAAHNVAIAVDTPSGLVVPNIKHCERRSLMDIALELQRVIGLAQTNKLPPEDLQGSTFSLSNIGAIAGTYASPVLVVPQVAIGAVGKIQKLPRYDAAGTVVPAHIMVVSWSADHRVIDGGTIANFSNLFKQYLEEPAAMLFDLK